MYSCNLKFFISVIILITTIIYVESECVENKAACTCVRADGQGYDLSLDLISPVVDLLHKFTFQPCKNVNLTFKGSNSSECDSTSLCMLNGNNQSINLGSIEESQWVTPSKNEDPHLIFTHQKYVTKISLVCCHDCGSKPALQLRVDNSSLSTNYNLIYTSRTSCLVVIRPKGLSIGSVLVILFVMFSGLYFIGGALALKFFRGAVGWELIPNYDFWSDLPALVRDGVTFALSGCSAVSYERI